MTAEGPVTASGAPSTRWYRVALGVFTVGLLLALGWFLHAVTVQTEAVNGFTDLRLFRGSTVEVAEPGDHTVWAGPGCNGGCRPESASTYRRHLDLRFEDPSGRPVPVRPAAEQYYNVGSGREGRAVWVAEFPAAGTYAPLLTTDGEVPQPSLFLRAGRGLPIRLARGSLFLAGGGALVAVAMALTTALLRRRAFDRMPPAIPRDAPGAATAGTFGRRARGR